MGVFYNPPPNIQIPFSQPLGGGFTPPSRKSAPKQDLEAEKAAAWKKAAEVGGDDPEKVAAAMHKQGYPEDATVYLDKHAKSEENKLKVQELEVNQELEQLRIAGDLARSGADENLTLRTVNKMIPDVNEHMIRMGYDPKSGNIKYERNNGETGETNLDGLIKAGTTSSDQFKEQAAYARVKLTSMKDPKTLSVQERLSNSYGKIGLIEKAMNEGATYDEVIKQHPEWVLLPHEEDLVSKDLEGSGNEVVAAIVSVNPGLIKTLGKTPAEAAKWVVDLNANIRKAANERRKERRKPATGVPGTGSVSSSTKSGESTSVEATTRSHPAFDKAVTMVSPDGREGKVAPENVEAAQKDGWKLK